MSGLKLLVLGALIGALAAISGQTVLYHLTDVLIATFLVTLVWSFLSIRGLRFARILRQDRAQVGEVIEQKLELRSFLPIPRVWLEFVDGGTLPGYSAGRILDLGMNGRRVWVLEARCVRRGLYQLGPARLSGSDPFGMFQFSRRVGGSTPVLVYPQTVDLTGFVLPGGNLAGGTRQRRGWQQTTSHVASVREYRPGDPVRHVHWPSTARSGRLMVKEFDAEPSADLWIVLDLHAAVQRGSGDESTEEYGVKVAASLGRHFLAQGRAVGLIAIGEEHRVLPSDRGQRQLLKLLEELAVVRADGSMPIAEVLAAEADRCTRSAALLVVTPSADESWPEVLQGVRDRGISGGAIVLEASTFDPAPNSLLLVGALASAGIPSLLVKRGDPLDRVLTANARWVGRG